MGGDVGRHGGCDLVTKGLMAEFGEDPIRDTPLSEVAFVGPGIAAAMAGLRPIVEIMTVNVSLLALDRIVNDAATIPHMSGGELAVPPVIRMAAGAERQARTRHPQCPEGCYVHIPGLRILAPATVTDARFARCSRWTPGRSSPPSPAPAAWRSRTRAGHPDPSRQG